MKKTKNFLYIRYYKKYGNFLITDGVSEAFNSACSIKNKTIYKYIHMNKQLII